jgi:hypothetical protein
MATPDKGATDKRATEEAAVKRAAKEATTKETTAEEVARKTTDEAAGAVGGSLAPGQAPSVARVKRAVAPSSSTLPAKRSYRGVWKPQFVQLSLLFSSVGLHSLITHFVQVLSLRRGHRDRHGCFCRRHHCCRCGCRGNSRTGS